MPERCLVRMGSCQYGHVPFLCAFFQRIPAYLTDNKPWTISPGKADKAGQFYPYQCFVKTQHLSCSSFSLYNADLPSGVCQRISKVTRRRLIRNNQINFIQATVSV